MSRSNERVTYLRNDRTGAEVCSPDNPPCSNVKLFEVLL